MQDYVLGFMFTGDRKKVALIRKYNPPPQRGFLNGIGGKIEPGEVPIHAMVREFREETGVDTSTKAWHEIGEIYFSVGRAFVFRTVIPERMGVPLIAEAGNKEIPNWYQIDLLGLERCMENLDFLVPLAASEYPAISFVLKSRAALAR